MKKHTRLVSSLSLSLSIYLIFLSLKSSVRTCTAMATEVSSLIRVMGGGYKEEQHRTVGNESHGEKSTALITRDLLGGSSTESQELDLDLQVPSGWEKRLDLQVCSNFFFLFFLGIFCFVSLDKQKKWFFFVPQRKSHHMIPGKWKLLFFKNEKPTMESNHCIL